MRLATLKTMAGCMALSALLTGCGPNKTDPRAEAPPPAAVEHEDDNNVIKVDHPEQFPLVAAAEHAAVWELKATGTVSPDVSRTVPVVSLATGRVVEIDARLGDIVKKGQLLLRVQSADLSAAFSDYRKAVSDEQLARIQLDRAKLLYDRGAISLNDLQVTEETHEKAELDAENTAEHVRVLGGDVNHPNAVADIRAPVSGVITDQQVTNAAGVAGLGAPNPFTISDLSRVWILCDVYENDLGGVRVGETAEIRLNAYPERAFTGRISNVSSVLDPNLRTAKVRIEVENPGLMRIGMFVTATFRGTKNEKRAAIPASAILHLHDRDWVFVPQGGNRFRRIEIVSGATLPSNMQEVLSGLSVGEKVVTNALSLQNAVDNE